ncbi:MULTISPECIES: hypothetical protein [unclassified Nonomuraea]|uniref:hypothetical protein n=1 Tax=unclassified Nonomuraea TaxID=2593643 RepID=UPI00340D2B07
MADDLRQCDPLELVAELRRQVSGLVAHIDTTGRPAPDHINDRTHRLPGSVWHPAPGWTVRTVNDESDLDTVFLTTPHMFDVSDFDAYRVASMRRVAMAMLAACDVAEQRVAGVVVLGGRDQPEHGECGGACRD